MANTKFYDADQVNMIFMGIPISSGYDDGVFLEINQEADDFLTKVGTDGETARSKSLNANADILVHLMQTSDGNAALSLINNLDKLLPNGAGVGPMLVRDAQGTSLYAATKCWIKKPPDAKFAREPSDRVWTLHCGDLSRLDGGN